MGRFMKNLRSSFRVQPKSLSARLDDLEVDVEQWCARSAMMGSLRRTDKPDVKRASSMMTQTRSKEESELLGVSVEYLRKEFINEVEVLFGVGADPDFYQINDKLLHGPNGRGFGIDCPRTGQSGASYVDALDSCHTGPANLMISWTWTYSVRTVVDTLVDWCESKGLDPRNVFVWQCALCCNQYRVQERRLTGEWESFETFKAIFEMRVQTIGHVLAILAPWQDPTYVKRAWCLFEFWIAATTPGVCLEVVGASKEKDSMMKAISSGWLLQQARGCLWFTVNVREASTTSPDDKANILRCIDPTASDFSSDSACLDELNAQVQERMSQWCIGVMLDALSPSCRIVEDPKMHMMAGLSAACVLSSKMTSEGYAMAQRVVRGSCAMAIAAGLSESHEYAALCNVDASLSATRGQSIDAYAKLLEVKSWGTLLPRDKAGEGWNIFCHPLPDLLLASTCVVQGRFQDSLEFLDGVQADVFADEQETTMAAQVCVRHYHHVRGLALSGVGHQEEARAAMNEAKTVFEQLGDTHGA